MPSRPLRLSRLRVAFLVAWTPLACGLALAADGTPVALDPVEVTTSKIPIPVSDVAADVSIVSGAELRARGANDLRTALSLVAGVDIAPGGDGGPASSVPALWGLREFDAFLLVVDGIPSGGAFTPALATLNLANVDHIEVLKGAAPVSYGATSFVGVINVFHYAAGQAPGQFEVGVGSRGSAHISAAIPLSDANAPWQQSLLVDGDKQELKANRADWDRAHVLYRGAGEVGPGKFSIDFDGTVLHQDPTSPHPRDDDGLVTRVPLDANDNPRGARQDENRAQIALGYVVPTGLGDWSTRLSFARSNAENIRGFLREDFADDGVTHNADGFQQEVHRTEAYLDTHIATVLSDQATLVWGLDHLYGKGDQESANFEYAVLPDGANAPDWRTLHIDERTRLDDRRNFSGLYADLDLSLTDAWKVQGGVRFNHTTESTIGFGEDLTGDAPVITDDGRDHVTNNRWAGALGTTYRLWQDGRDYVSAYVNYRNTFKPAVVDFGPEPEFDILKPEDARSTEVGFKGRAVDGRLEWDLSVFDMKFHNLVVTTEEDGLPALTNAGNEQFKGAEVEARWQIADGFSATGTYAHHNARFGNYLAVEDGELQQFKGNRLELSPENLASIGLMYAQAQGFHGYVVGDYVGSRFLDKGNTIVAGGYTTLDAGFGYAWDRYDVRLDGYNLSDRRDPVAESELGDAQFYRVPARSFMLSFRCAFGH